MEIIGNRYRIIQPLGEGGMGVVYKVLDELEQRELALKLLSKSFKQEEEFYLKFKQEFWTMVKLKHPNTVNVYDYGIEDGIPYFTMEIVPGKELTEFIKPDYEFIYKVLIQICQVLDFIHSRLLVHCDIKPQNIRIKPDGTLKLMDFGLMSQLGTRSSGKITGTVAYLPPEIATGGIINESSDLYSVGIMIYELITGIVPFIGKSALEIIKAHINIPPRDIIELRSDCPSKLNKIVMKLLAKKQQDRYKKASEVLIDLQELVGKDLLQDSVEQKKSYLTTSVIVGRDNELKKLQSYLDKLVKGEGQSVFIAAPAGVGKSRLVQEVKLMAQLSEIPFLMGKCYEQGMTSYQPMIEFLKRSLPYSDMEILNKYGNVLVKILPRLKEKKFTPLPPLDSMAEKARLYDNVNNYLRDISKKIPLIVFIDDLHWADLTSIEMLNSCIRELKGSRILFLGTFRNDEVPNYHPLWQTVEENYTDVIKLNTFTKENIQELLKAMFGEVNINPQFIEQIASNTGGNAFFITEVIRFLIEEDHIKLYKGEWSFPDDITSLSLPTNISSTILKRISKLSPNAVNILNIMAVIGHRVDLYFFQKLTNLSENDLFLALDELIEKQFLSKSEQDYIFPHDRIRETIYSSLDASLLSEYHQRVGEFIERENINNLEPYYSELAYHYSRGTNKQKAVEYLIKAGEKTYERMQASFLMKQGVDILEKIDYPNKHELLLKTYEKLAWVSYMIAPRICLEVNEKLVKKLEEMGNVPLEEIYEHKCLAVSSYTMIGQNDKAYKITEEMLSKAQNNSLAYALALFGQLNAHLTTGRLRRLVNEMEQVVEILSQNLDKLSTQLHWVYGFSSFIREDAIAYLGEKVGNNKYSKNVEDMAFKYEFLDLQFWRYYPEVVRNSLIGEYLKIKNIQPELFTMIKRMGRPIQHENRFNVCLTFAAIEFGDLKEAKILVDKILELGARLGNYQQQANGKLLKAMLCEEELNFHEALEFYKDALAISREAKIDQLFPSLYRLGTFYIKRGEYNLAKPLIEEAFTLVTSDEFQNPYHQIHVYRAKGLLYLNEDKINEALDCLKVSLDIAIQTENIIQQAFTLYTYGSLYEKLQEYSKALDYYQQSINLFMQLNNVYQSSKVKKSIENINKLKQNKVQKSIIQTKETVNLTENKLAEIGYKFIELISSIKELNLELNLNQQTDSKELEKVKKINKFGQLVLSSLDLQTVLNKIIEQVIEITNADRGFLILLNDKNEFDTQVVKTKDNSNSKQVLNFSKSFVNKVINTGKSLWVQDAMCDSEFCTQASILEMELRSILCVPLKIGNKIIGVIYVDRQAVIETFTEEDLSLIESLSTFASISLINAKLHLESQIRSERLQMLNDLSKTISSTFVLDDLLKLVIQFCLEITKGELGYIILGEDLNRVYGLDKQGNNLDELIVSKTVIEYVKTKKQPLVSTDTSLDESLSKQASIMALDLKSIMCVPILSQDKFIGLVYISSNAVNKCFDENDLELMIAIIGQIALAIDNLQLLEIQKKQEKIERELEIAHSVQNSMLPNYEPEILTLDISGYSCPAAKLGGDYYDYFKISDSKFGLAVGDVNGHGITASLLMAMAKSCLFVQGQIDPSVIPVMTALNKMVYGGIKERLFMTFIYSVFDIFNYTVTFSSAGHHLPYFYKNSLKKLEPIDFKPVYPLGVRENVKFKEITLKLEPGDILVYYTDGIVEAKNLQNEEFGFERLESIILNNSNLTASQLKDKILFLYKEWIKGNEFNEDLDDVTVVVVKVKPIKEINETQKLKTGFLTLIGR